MAHYKVQTDRGLVEFDAERADLSHEEVEQVINQNTGGSSPEPKSSPILEKIIGKKAYVIASGPMNTAEKLLNATAEGLTPNPEVTNRPAIDVMRNAPAIGARSLAKVLPGFVSPESMATAAIAPALGAVGKGARALARPAGRFLGTAAEDLAGMVPGALREAFNDAGAIVGPGKKAASPLYEAGKVAAPTKRAVAVGLDKLEEIRDIAKTATDHRTLFDAATKLEKSNVLDPDIALAARKSMWKIKKTIPEDRFYEMLTKFNKVIKANPEMAKADKMYQKGLMSESLRSVFPKTAGGKASAWKTMMAGLSGVPAVFSPAALGATSTTAGLVGRKLLSPLIDAPIKPALTAVALLRSRRGKE